LGGDATTAEKFLREHIIPRLNTLSGFQSARFFRTPDETVGMGVGLFDTEENAESARQAMLNNRPPGAPPVTTSAVYELFLEV
jgi:hypothetical protein